MTFYLRLPDEVGADELEAVTGNLIAALNGNDLRVLNATWSCPEIGRKAAEPGPVLAFRRDDA